ncbi:MAG TPA: hypothetical protein VHA53_10305, partial [Nitrolancea sp.]|nr:hypothetical protein [Nitrolancea sp.]
IVGLKHARRTIILCTHDLAEAERLADDIAIIQHGRLVAHGSPAGLRLGATPDTLVRIELAEPVPAALSALERDARIDAPAMTAVGEHVFLSYRTSCPNDVNPDVISALVGLGARIVAVNCETRSLEEVYSAMVSEQPLAPGRDLPGVLAGNGSAAR